MTSQDYHPSAPDPHNAVFEEDHHASASVGNEVPSITSSGPEVDVKVPLISYSSYDPTDLGDRALMTTEILPLVV